AGGVIVVLPTLILLFLGQKRLQQGLTEGAIK
ncbi:MAG TPA: carbohydrate ABC transporter permease, partial [Bacillota bacterium]|nr:carbohydrate ABC transporter permease [Bacillota bacterium]